MSANISVFKSIFCTTRSLKNWTTTLRPRNLIQTNRYSYTNRTDWDVTLHFLSILVSLPRTKGPGFWFCIQFGDTTWNNSMDTHCVVNRHHKAGEGRCINLRRNQVTTYRFPNLFLKTCVFVIKILTSNTQAKISSHNYKHIYLRLAPSSSTSKNFVTTMVDNICRNFTNLFNLS